MAETANIQTDIEFMKTRIGDLKLSDTDRVEFLSLYSRWLQPSADQNIEWERVNPPSAHVAVPYDQIPDADLPAEEVKSLLGNFCVIKLNGGLGTTMGCTGPKTLIPVRGADTFLTLTLKQIATVRRIYGVKVPLVLMNSFNTTEATLAALDEIKTKGGELAEVAADTICFEQSCFPRIDLLTHKTLEEVSDEVSAADPSAYAPPGHGNILMALVGTGTAQLLLDRGIKYAFISNGDNLGATMDLRILNHVYKSELDFVSEYTPKTQADIKGGTLIHYHGRDGRDVLRLMEKAQVPVGHEQDFLDIERFPIFNTNSLYLNLEALVAITEGGRKPLELDIIANEKTVAGRRIVQLETAVGTAITRFTRSAAVVVPRSRFLPVKTTSDLLLVRSDLFVESEGLLVRSCIPEAERTNMCAAVPPLPLVSLCSEYSFVQDFDRYFQGVPSLLRIKSLSVRVPHVFTSNDKLEGDAVVE